MDKSRITIECILITSCLILGIALIGYGCAQDMYLMPFYKAWSDIWAYLTGLIFLALAWMLHVDSINQRYFRI
ncbi:hypothetical protein [Paraburkholderia sp. SIMBA_054]|uniref:hypothetical protein n=1 Tax=Paraburkholderia sp. SIMBA_054 TaxID=3085795 RepID=UPI00397E5B63